MPAILTIPPATPYAGNLYPYGIANAAQAPPEGPMAISASFAWATDGSSILVNAAQPGSIFSQICGLYVNNATCSQPVNFFFQDTQYQLTVPAYAIGWYPVYTRLLQFTAYCPNAQSGDQTFIQIYNSLIQSPATGSVFQRGQAANFDALAFGTPGTTVSTTLFNGPCIVTNVCAGVANVLASSTGAFLGGIQVLDGTTEIFFSRIGLQASGFRDTALMINLQGISVRFHTNLTVAVYTFTGTTQPVSGYGYFNIQYQPGIG
jgi:hypothetical protein